MKIVMRSGVVAEVSPTARQRDALVEAEQSSRRAVIIHHESDVLHGRSKLGGYSIESISH
jgi:hypothetical protein